MTVSRARIGPGQPCASVVDNPQSGHYNVARSNFRGLGALYVEDRVTERTTIGIATFRERYAKRPLNPRIDCQPHELVKLDAGHGVRALQQAPAQGVCFGRPWVSREDPGRYTYLWVMDNLGIPYIIERPLLILNGSHPKHTNLTGGADAYLGGEIWFSDGISCSCQGVRAGIHPFMRPN